MVSAGRYEMIKSATGFSDEELARRKIDKIHPSFRMIALAEPPNLQDSSQQWLIPELLPLFFYHQLDPLPIEEEIEVLRQKVPAADKKLLKKLVTFVDGLRHSSDVNVKFFKLKLKFNFFTIKFVKLE